MRRFIKSLVGKFKKKSKSDYIERTIQEIDKVLENPTEFNLKAGWPGTYWLKEYKSILTSNEGLSRAIKYIK